MATSYMQRSTELEVERSGRIWSGEIGRRTLSRSSMRGTSSTRKTCIDDTTYRGDGQLGLIGSVAVRLYQRTTSSADFGELQRVQNAIATAVSFTRKKERTKPILKCFHWLPIVERVTCKMHEIAAFVYNTKRNRNAWLRPYTIHYWYVNS